MPVQRNAMTYLYAKVNECDIMQRMGSQREIIDHVQNIVLWGSRWRILPRCKRAWQEHEPSKQYPGEERGENVEERRDIVQCEQHIHITRLRLTVIVCGQRWPMGTAIDLVGSKGWCWGTRRSFLERVRWLWYRGGSRYAGWRNTRVRSRSTRRFRGHVGQPGALIMRGTGHARGRRCCMMILRSTAIQ